MNLSQDRLNAFIVVAKHRSFTKASEELGLTQSALSHRIKNLESDLNLALFIREPANLYLTEAGERLLKYCQVQAKFEEEFIGDLTSQNSKELRGALRLASVSSLAWSVVCPAVGELIRQNPLVHVDIMSREVSELPHLLKQNRVDFVITVEKIGDCNLEEKVIGVEKYVLVELSSISLRKNIYLDHDEKDKFTNDFLYAQKNEKPILNRSFMDDVHGLLAGVREGFGRAVVPKHLVEENDEIVIVKGFKPLEQSIRLYYKVQPFYTKLHREVVKTLEKNVSKCINSK